MGSNSLQFSRNKELHPISIRETVLLTPFILVFVWPPILEAKRVFLNKLVVPTRFVFVMLSAVH
jgi:hypothetical protein